MSLTILFQLALILFYVILFVKDVFVFISVYLFLRKEMKEMNT